MSTACWPIDEGLHTMEPPRMERQDTEIALLRRDLQEIRAALWGDKETGGKGVLHRFEDIERMADRGKWTVRVALWVGGAAVAILTAIGQLRSILSGHVGLH
jgi:hypothetical protein